MAEWGFWVAAGGISLSVVAGLLAALFQRREAALPPGTYDLQVYRAQLADVDRDVSTGVIMPAEADRLRAEISRRILDAGRSAQQGAAGVSLYARIGAGVAVTLLLASAIFGYVWLGAPGYPDLPLADRLAAFDAARATRPSQAVAEAAAGKPVAVEPDAEMAALMATLRQVLITRPDDVEGLTLLARNEAALGNLAAAAKAQTALIAAKGAEVSAADHMMLAEILIRLAGAYVSPEAEAALMAALQLEPRNGTARYYSGLMFAQAGRADRAFLIWQDLLADSAADAPWVAPIRSQMGDVARLAGVAYDQPQVPGPSADQVDAAQDMSPEDRMAMIQSMVDGLSARLASEGGSAQDWARLITSLGVLGQTDQARLIYAEAQGVFAGRDAEIATLRAAAIAAAIAE